MEKLGIIVFGHTRALHIADILKSLEKQNELKNVHVWLDGHQGIPDLKAKTEQVYDIVSQFPVAKIYQHNGNLGFRKLILQALSEATHQFEQFIVLEDDCFPTKNAIETFRNELNIIAQQDDIFSVYGHHFLSESETETCNRFQGWGWATTSKKMKPLLEQLIDCYSLTEERYLEFVNNNLTKEILNTIDVTPPRNPSATLRKFFAWDETLSLLTALKGMKHKKTPERVIYNFGACQDSSRFKNIEWYKKPPFNMISHEDIWTHY